MKTFPSIEADATCIAFEGVFGTAGACGFFGEVAVDFVLGREGESFASCLGVL